MFKQKGFTLTELMISLSLSLLLYLTFYEAYFVLQNIYQLQTALIFFQQRALVLQFQLSALLEKVDYTACRQLNKNFANALMPAKSIYGLSAKKVPRNTFSQTLVLPSDVLFLNIVSQFSDLSKNMISNQEISLKRADDFQEQDVLYFADCFKTDISTIAQKKGCGKEKSFTLTQPIPRYEKNSLVALVTPVCLYLAQTKRKENGHIVYALYEKRGNTAQELMQDVQSFNIQYGILQEHHLIFLNADQIKNWTDVLAVRFDIGLQENAGGKAFTKNWRFVVVLNERI